MSYIRHGQEGQYVDIPHGSMYYLYGNGDDISGWSYQQFAGIILEVLDEIDVENEREIRVAFSNHFGGVDDEYDGGIAFPEKAEIFCQCVDSRIDPLELTDDLQEAVQEAVDPMDHVRQCDICGDEYRSMFVGHEWQGSTCMEDECHDQWLVDEGIMTWEEIEELEEMSMEELREGLFE